MGMFTSLRGGATGAARARLPRLAWGLALLVGIVPLLLAGCSPQQADAAQLASDQTFTWPYYGATKVNYGEMLDPASASSAVDAGTIDMIYASLISFNGDLQPQADAAASWKVDSTGTVYTFSLRHGMKFSDGTSLTAEDFAYSIDRALNPFLCQTLDANSYGVHAASDASSCVVNGATYLVHILGAAAKLKATSPANVPSLISDNNNPNRGLTVVDPSTLQIKLDAPVAFFLDALSYPTSYVVEKSLVENPAYAGGTWVAHLDTAGCSGPFKISSYGDGSQLTLVPNPAWEDAWGQRLILTRVVRPLVDTQDDAYANYRKGQYDEADVPLADYATASGQGDFQQLPGLITRYFGVNLQKPPFVDNSRITVKVDGEQNPIDVGEAIRRAFALALNKQVLVDRFTSGAATPTNNFVPRGMPGYDSDLKNPQPDGTESVTGNQTAAQKLIASARATCPSFVSSSDKDHAYCKYIAASNPQEIDLFVRTQKQTEIAISTAAKDQWNNVLGVNVAVRTDDTDTFFNNLYATDPDTNRSANPYPMWSIGWQADYTDPQDWLTVFFTVGAPNNTFGLSDKGLDDLLAKADSEQDTAARMQLYNQAEQNVIDQVILIPYQQEKLLWRQRPWLRGFGFNSLDLVPDINWANVEILQH